MSYMTGTCPNCGGKLDKESRCQTCSYGWVEREPQPKSMDGKELRPIDRTLASQEPESKNAKSKKDVVVGTLGCLFVLEFPALIISIIYNCTVPQHVTAIGVIVSVAKVATVVATVFLVLLSIVCGIGKSYQIVHRAYKDPQSTPKQRYSADIIFMAATIPVFAALSGSVIFAGISMAADTWKKTQEGALVRGTDRQFFIWGGALILLGIAAAFGPEIMTQDLRNRQKPRIVQNGIMFLISLATCTVPTVIILGSKAFLIGLLAIVALVIFSVIAGKGYSLDSSR